MLAMGVRRYGASPVVVNVILAEIPENAVTALSLVFSDEER